MARTATVDLYAILGVAPGDDRLTIRGAYRHLARRHHPDAGGDPRIMMVLNKSWWILGDPGRRAAYDHQRAWPVAGARTPGTAASAASPSVAPRARPFGPVADPMMAPPPNLRASGTVMDFGRYAGWSVGQLAIYDPDYLLWLERTPIGRPMRREIQETLTRVRPEPVLVGRPRPTGRRAFATMRR